MAVQLSVQRRDQGRNGHAGSLCVWRKVPVCLVTDGKQGVLQCLLQQGVQRAPSITLTDTTDHQNTTVTFLKVEVAIKNSEANVSKVLVNPVLDKSHRFQPTLTLLRTRKLGAIPSSPCCRLPQRGAASQVEVSRLLLR